MPKNPFVAHQSFETKPKRNTFDLSFQNNMTCRFGDLVPVFCKEVNPGDSISIDAAYALKFMPMVFPVQTPIRASMHFFYVRNRNLWKEWMDFAYGNREDVTHPYLAFSAAQLASNLFKTGGLGDYLGLPTTVSSDQAVEIGPSFDVTFFTFAADSLYLRHVCSSQPRLAWSDYGVRFWDRTSDLEIPANARFSLLTLSHNEQRFLTLNRAVVSGAYAPAITNSYLQLCLYHGYPNQSGVPVQSGIIDPDTFFEFDVVGSDGAFSVNIPQKVVDKFNYYISQGQRVSFAVLETFSGEHPAISVDADHGLTGGYTLYLSIHNVDAVDSGYNLGRLKISALPFRAYESIYNAFYRDIQNDPWTIDDVPQYNNYCTTHEGGSDSTLYHIFQRNWEKDFLTSALPSPQQGIAPLVGITSTGRMQFQREDGSVVEVQSEYADDGTITGFKTSEALQDPTVRAAAFRAVSEGISINDFRNVNALQRWLENNIRRGLKYRDQVLANTGVDIRYDELDMPEFLGGFSRMVNITQVTQTAPGSSENDPLGSYAGQANLFGGSQHRINHYCDEAGFIMGIMCVVPQPSYSQLLPKMFLKSTALDYFQPVFGHIGMQPITYAEVCPLQAMVESRELTDTFGYQRPYYDLIASVDEVHGKMRTDMRDFIMNRTFAVAPELGPEFLHIDPAQVNQVFSYTDPDEHVIMGQLVFQCYKKTAIPRFGIPRLEA